MPFKPGQSGNPAGRPPGTRNKVNRAMEPVFQANGEAIIERLVEHAKAANPVALRLCVDRLVPMGKHRPVGFQIPPMHKSDDVRAAIATIHGALGDGDISSGEAVDLLRVAEVSARMLREAENAPTAIAARLDRYEQALAHLATMLGFGPATSAEPADEDETAAAEEAPIANNNAETMSQEAAPSLDPDAAKETAADAAAETGPIIVNNNAETMTPAAFPPGVPGLSASQSMAPSYRAGGEPLHALSG